MRLIRLLGVVSDPLRPELFVPCPAANSRLHTLPVCFIAAHACHRTQSMHRDRDNRHRYRLITCKKLGQNFMACGCHRAGIGTLRDSFSVVCARAGSYRAGLERRNYKLSRINFLGQVDKRIHQKTFRLKACHKKHKGKTLCHSICAFCAFLWLCILSPEWSTWMS